MRKPRPRVHAPRVETEAESLFAAFCRTRDPALRARLVALHENLVRFLAAKFANRGEPLDDLIQVGTIGLINAIDRYEPARGTRFSTYATPTIVGEIKRYFRDRAWNLKVPRWLQELNFHVMRANDILAQRLGRAPNVAEIAAYVGCTEENALNAMELGNAYETISLDTSTTLEGDIAVSLNDSIGVLDTDLDLVDAYDDLKLALTQLDNRERMVIYLRYFHELSQTEVARRLNISQMHVSRLQHRALERLKQILSEERLRYFRDAA